jgi:hypothetical protein
LESIPALVSLLRSWFWLAANSGCWDGIEKLPVLGQVAVRAKRYKVRERIVPVLAAFDPVVHLQVPG